MKLSKLIDDLAVPLMVAVGAFLFWFHIKDAPAVAARVPHAIIIFIVLMLLVVVRKLLRQGLLNTHTPSKTSDEDTTDAQKNLPAHPSTFLGMLRKHSVEVFFLIGLLYFLTFETLGFSISNFIFICLCMSLVKNYQSNFSPKDVTSVLLTAFITTGLLHLFAKLTSFNIPSGIFGI